MKIVSHNRSSANLVIWIIVHWAAIAQTRGHRHASIDFRSSLVPQNILMKHGQKWQKEAFITEGKFGEVYKVTRDGARDAAKAFVLKTRKKGLKKLALQAGMGFEAAKMTAITHDLLSAGMECFDTLLHVIDSTPQVPGISPENGAFVIELMDGDLNDWRLRYAYIETITTTGIPENGRVLRTDLAPSDVMKRCAPHIAKLARTALQCLHTAGWVHMDVKLGNFLYRGLYSRGPLSNCPKEVRLADFGSAVRLGQSVEKIDFFYTALYQPSDMFNRPPDAWWRNDIGTLPLEPPYHRDSNTYKAQEALDWCGFRYIWKEFLGFDPNDLLLVDTPKEKAKLVNYYPGDCGAMGEPRRKTSFQGRDEAEEIWG